MAQYTERKILNSIELLVEQSAVNVCWLNQVLRDGTVIGSEPYRRAYCQEEKGFFIADIESPANGGQAGDAAPYIAALGW